MAKTLDAVQSKDYVTEALELRSQVRVTSHDDTEESLLWVVFKKNFHSFPVIVLTKVHIQMKLVVHEC